MTVELGNISLTHLTDIDVREDVKIVRHAVPGMDGDISQLFGRQSVEINMSGLFYGEDADDNLDILRTAYLEREPLDFFTQSVGEGYFSQVLITNLKVAQRAGYLDQYHYQCVVVEYVEPPEPLALDPLSAIDDDLLGEAIDFVDDVQNAIEEVSGLVDLITNFPSFGDPTTRLPSMLDEYATTTSDGISTLTTIRDIF